MFKLNGAWTGWQVAASTAGRIVTTLGKKAGVVVNKEAGKFASAHDLRRAFGTRWARLVKPAVLMVLMRHESIETTLSYYVDLDADDIADELQAAYDARQRLHDIRDDAVKVAQLENQELITMAAIPYEAEGMGFEPTTGFPAPHFQCGR